ncbi:MAG: serine hydrolase [Pseudomonadota bacterium]
MNRLVSHFLVLVLSAVVVGCNPSDSERAPSEQADYSLVEVTLEDYNDSYSESFRDVPQLEQVFYATRPANRGDGVPVGDLRQQGGDSGALIQLVTEIAESNEENYDSLLIARNGELVFEAYFKRGRVNLPHPQASATKTYTSLLLGRAIQLGHLTMDDLDKPIVSFFEALDRTSLVEGAERITLREAVTMTTGIRLDDAQWGVMRDNPDRMQGQRQVQYMLETSQPIGADSKTFKYGTGPDLVMQILEVSVPGGARAFIKNEFLNKLGITEYECLTEVNGLPVAGWLTSFTSRDMTKFGHLVMNEGRWNGEQFVPVKYLEASMVSSVLTGDEDIYGGGPDVSNIGYGYFWWTADLRSEGKTYSVANAQGGGGQYIIPVDELDLLIVVTGHSNDNTTLQRVAERIIPAFRH